MEDRQINNESRMSKEEEEESMSDFLDMIIKKHPEVWRNITDTLTGWWGFRL